MSKCKSLVRSILSSPPPTLKEVARAAGVSRATASRVLSEQRPSGDRTRRAAETRRAVERAARALGYVPNQTARSLRTGRTSSIALVIPEPVIRLFGDPLFPRVVRGITDVLAASDLQLVLLAPQTRADENRLEHYLTSGHVDGALLLSLHGDDPLPGRLAEHGLPAVVGGRPPAGSRVSYADVDNVGGAVAATRHLCEGGRRRVATITGPLDMPAARDRLDGYRQALRAAGLRSSRSLVESGDFSRNGGEGAMRTLLEREPRLDAVFVASDLMAAGALQVLSETGRAVPADVAVVGFDDSPFAASTIPPLSSVMQPIEELGREMTRLLLAAIESRDRVARQVILATDLVVRASSGG
jgi:DNA-binding LacI/PurR family transcriptional regulator